MKTADTRKRTRACADHVHNELGIARYNADMLASQTHRCMQRRLGVSLQTSAKQKSDMSE